MANDSATRVPDAVEPAESAASTNPPESTLPPTSDLVLPYQSRAADREQLPAKDDHTADRRSRESASESDTGANSERVLADTDGAKPASEPAHPEESSTGRDRTTLADLRSTDREPIARLDSQRPDPLRLNAGVARPDALSENQDHSSPVVDRSSGHHDGAAGPEPTAAEAPSETSKSWQSVPRSDASNRLLADHEPAAIELADKTPVGADGLVSGRSRTDLQGEDPAVAESSNPRDEQDLERARTLEQPSSEPMSTLGDQEPSVVLLNDQPRKSSRPENKESDVRVVNSLEITDAEDADNSSARSEGDNAPTIPIYAENYSRHITAADLAEEDRHEFLERRESAGFQVGPEEEALQNKEVRSITDIDPNGHVNAAFKLDFEDGTGGVYKPSQGESASLRIDVPVGNFWNREIAASRLDDMLQFDLVPTTTDWDGHRGVGSVQEWNADATDALSVDWYIQEDQDKMAVLDYVSGNTDRHDGNYLTDIDQHPVAIDHGCSFPEGPGDPIRSDFVAERFGKQLGNDVMDAVRAVDSDEFVAALRSAGLKEIAIDGALARLEEIQNHGMITGDAWLPGKIVDADWRTVR